MRVLPDETIEAQYSRDVELSHRLSPTVKRRTVCCGRDATDDRPLEPRRPLGSKS